MTKSILTASVLFALCLLPLAPRPAPDSLPGQDLLGGIARLQDFTAGRISSYDRSGGNRDSVFIRPGETAVLAEIRGPGAIDHIWVTIAAEPFYGRKIVFRAYWDDEESPSIEAPIGDFFGVGHGLNRDFSSLPLVCSSEGRARNAYWLMPFRRSARLTVTNEGAEPVQAFYYYVDYRELPDLPAETPYFHAQYRQEMPCRPGHNYAILEASGRGTYVGCNLSVLQNSMGWWGEGDDMIYVDGSEEPTLHGTGSEDYFSDAWGMREDENLFYGCPLQETDFQAGSKATVYRWHIPDPVPFRRSIRVTIEHGHANDRADDYSSTAYWYQTEPHAPFPALPDAARRLPFAWSSPEGFIRPSWTNERTEAGTLFADSRQALAFWTPKAPGVSLFDSAYYDRTGTRYPLLLTESAKAGETADVSFTVEVPDRYTLDLYFLKGPDRGNLKPVSLTDLKGKRNLSGPEYRGYSSDKGIGRLGIEDLSLPGGACRVTLEVTAREKASSGDDFGFVGLALSPYKPRYITDWNVIGPFSAPDMTSLTTSYPPEKDLSLDKTYRGKDGREVKWTRIRGEESGYVRLDDKLKPNAEAIAYGLVFVFAPEETETYLLAGSDDGIRVWLNGDLVLSVPVYRAAVPDEDTVKVRLRKGWNTCLVKDLQGEGGWGFYIRFADPDHKLSWSVEPPPAKK
jgi:hypothetical protein